MLDVLEVVGVKPGDYGITRRQVVFERAAGKCENCGEPLGEVTTIDLFFGPSSTIAESWAICSVCKAQLRVDAADNVPSMAWIDRFVSHLIAAAFADPANATGYARAIDRATAWLAQLQHAEGIL